MTDIGDTSPFDPPPSSDLWLIRHGESTGNRDGLLQGQEDLPLTDLGHEQANKLAQRLARIDFSAIYSSDLGRALQTAVPLSEALHQSVALDARLREIHVGRWAGLTDEQIKEAYPDEWAKWQDRDPHLARGGGESYAVAQARIVAVLEELALRHAGERIAVVCHGGVMRAYLAHLLQLDLRDMWHITIGNTGICRIRPFAPSTGGSKHRYGRIETVNDLAHLEMPMAHLSTRTVGGTTRLLKREVT
jgi:broad specificity phosphatase PhoE